ncbi:hypothetical protein KM043_003145 [Ampulex compressa]|nr:hypothetical protein KM043_003145 [Ampulex compressa]
MEDSSLLVLRRYTPSTSSADSKEPPVADRWTVDVGGWSARPVSRWANAVRLMELKVMHQRHVDKEDRPSKDRAQRAGVEYADCGANANIEYLPVMPPAFS